MSKKEQQTFILELKILSKILRSSWTMDRSTLALLGERHLMLEKTIIPLIPDSSFISPEVEQRLKQAESTRNDFIIDIQEAFLTNNTRFVDYLKSFSLTRSELNYCSLLTLGLRGKEIGLTLTGLLELVAEGTVENKRELLLQEIKKSSS